ncbi:unnamed protein product [Triticum turgidum subsp. durum]|uniref:Vacuolar protein sorting-associated protein 24 homolog 1-like n=1 Tax=Triticum turgidum subsp. durum TaxID=4567 RepID=A0A9R0TCZ5_TRITD|nr:unnamed protein product [Triticum turgidum subsp. durum]
MEAVKSLLKPKPTPQQQLREWQRRLRNEGRNIERQIRDVQKEEKKVEKAIKESARRGDMGSAKALAKELVQSRKAVNRLYENKAQLNSISMHLGEIVATTRTVGHLSKSTEVMKLVNNLMKAPEIAVTMQEIEEEVDKVLSAIAGETASQLPDAVRKQKEKVTQPSTSEPAQRTAVAESVDEDDDDLEKIRERLAKVRS